MEEKADAVPQTRIASKVEFPDLGTFFAQL